MQSSKFRFPWEIRQLIILALMSGKKGGITVNNDHRSEAILYSLEQAIGKNTEWKTGQGLFGDMDTGLSEEVIELFLFMVIGKILRDRGVESSAIRVALHDKVLIGALDGALKLLKDLN